MKHLFTLLLVVSWSVRLWSATAPPPPSIAGPTGVSAGATHTYSYTESFISAPSFYISSGSAVINSVWSIGNTYYASVTWSSSGTLNFEDEITQSAASVNVTVVGFPSVTSASACARFSMTLSATPGAGSTVVRWYTASTGGSPINSTTSYVTPPLTGTTTYYVESWNTTHSVASSPRTPVTATVITSPLDEPESVTGALRCGHGSLTLSAEPDSPSNTIIWYTSPTGTDTVYTGLTFTTPELTGPTAYYAASYDEDTGCASARVEVLAGVDQTPLPGTAWSEPIRYGSGQTELEAESSMNNRRGLTVGSKLDTAVYDVLWYASAADAENDDSRLANAITYTTPVLTATTTYYVRYRDKESGCFSEIFTGRAQVIPYVTNASVREDVIRVTGKKTELSLSTLTDAEKVTSFSYLDGLGRVTQSTVLRGSPEGKDIVMPFEYDVTGRAAKNYLPYVSDSVNGSFHSTFKAEQQLFYLAANDKIADDSAAYAQAVYEQSPRGLLLEQGNIGKSFQPGQGHASEWQYSFNTAGDYVRLFDRKGNSTGWHPANALTKIKTIDAEGNHTTTFKDGNGQTILVRQWIDASLEGTYTDYLETYYVYDDLGQVTFIISPKGTAELKAGSWTFSSTIKDSYCNQFRYDSKGRVIEKKVPGQAWQYIIYDPLGRVVLTQDGLLRPDNKWMFIKYDYPGHAVMTGIHTNTTYTTRAAMQGYVDGLYVSGHATYGENSWFEEQGSTLEGYTNVSFPKDDIDVLSVNYFDDYDFDNTGGADASYVSAGLTGEHTPAAYSFGQATGSKRKILGTGTWLKTYVFYDDRGRTIQVQTTNSINTGNVDRVTNAYADDGRLLYSKNHHDGGAYVILNKYEYTARGDLWKVSQDNGGTGSAYQLVAQYEYNELGQLVDKKLHDTGSGAFLQSVDYRYTIRGQLKSINNSELSGNSSNDDTDTDHDDYFGMELLYNETESGLTTNNRYDGSITAMKWKRIGAASGTAGQQSYAFTYDKTGRLENAGYALKESAWDKELGAQDETITYDHNGNIKTLKRKQREYGWGTTSAEYSAQTIDSLAYSYASGDKNRLITIDDPAGDDTGFKNGASTATEYRYDVNGNLTSDKNKGIDSIYYNFLGKPVRMDFADHRRIEYVYDAGGSKLTQKLYHYDTLKTTTHYANGFVYEAAGAGSPVLSFFGSPEGRVVNNSGTLTYEYSIADHQGNTRVVFTSDAPSANTVTVNFESATNSDVLNYTRTNFELFDHTDVSGSTYTYSQKLTGASGSQVGVAKTLKVYPGDKVKIEAYAKYYNPTGTSSNITGFAAALTGAFGVSSSSTGEALKAYNTLNNYGGIIAAGGSGGSGSYPKLFVNILLFDKDYNFLDAAWEQIDGGEQVGASPKAAHDLMSKEVTVKEAGFAYVFVSNENPTLVEFYVDDVVITHTPTNVIQYNEYYPFGLQTSSSWTRESTKGNQYLYNAANELNPTSGWYEMHYRGYDPAIGRMLQVDPYAPLFASTTAYNYSLNNPVMINDPTGGLSQAGYTDSQLHTMYRQARYNGEYNSFGDWAMDNIEYGTGSIIDGLFGERYAFGENGRVGRLVLAEYTFTYSDGVEAEYLAFTRWEVTDPERTAAVAAAASKKGTPYSQLDCSALVDFGTTQAGIKTKKGNGVGKWNNGVALIVGNSRKVSADKIRVGDVATFKSGRSDHKGKDGEFDHIGIISVVGYIDGKVAGFKMWHAGGSGTKEVYVDLVGGLAGYELKGFYQWDTPDAPSTSGASNSATISQGPSSFGHWLINNSDSGTGLSKLGYLLMNNGF